MPEKCAETCPQLEELKHDVRELREQGRKTHKEIFDRLREIDTTNAVQNERYENTMRKLDEISRKLDTNGSRIGAIEMEPAQKWKDFVKLIFAAFVGAAIDFLLRGGVL